MHLCSVTYPEAAELGIDNLEHGFFVNTQLDPDKQLDVCPAKGGFPTLQAMDPDGPQAKTDGSIVCIDSRVSISRRLATRAQGSQK